MGENENTYAELLKAQAHIYGQTHSYINSAALKCAVQLGIPDVIHNHGKPMTTPELAAALPINQAKAHFLRHLMRVLVNSGIFAQENDDEDDADFGNSGYILTPSSRLLLDTPLSARKLVIVNLDPRTLKPWENLGAWFKNDDATPFYTTYGVGSWEFAAKNSDLGTSINELMAEDSRLTEKALLNECKGVFERLTSLLDVAGGTGTMARAITKVFPNLKCIVFDQPHVVANCEGNEKVEFIGGDMFEMIPSANAILLKMILHNWSDKACVTILKKCREAVPSKDKGGKVIVIDIAMENNRGEDNTTFEAQSFYDMKMMVILGGKERNKREWAKLFSEAGFSHHNITPLGGLKSVIEAYP